MGSACSVKYKSSAPTVGIQIRADGVPQCVFGFLQRIFLLNLGDFARGQFGFGTINIIGRESAKLERAFIVVVTGLRLIDGFLIDNQSLQLQHDEPIIADNVLNN